MHWRNMSGCSNHYVKFAIHVHMLELEVKMDFWSSDFNLVCLFLLSLFMIILNIKHIY